jgi:hypothetical protein
MSPRRNYRDPEEYYDVEYDTIPEMQDVSRIINHPRKLVTVNLCANPYTAQVQEIFYERTCYEDEVEKTY